MSSSKPIFILGSHKSGTTLLRCLLDGHPSLAILPIETHAFAAAGFPISYALRPSNPYKPRFKSTLFRKRIDDILEFYAETNDRKGDFVPADYMENKKLKNTAMHFSDQATDPKSKILEYWEHIFTIFELDSANKRIVEKSVEHLEFVKYLKKFFPDATFLHILRNPYRNLLSIRTSKHSNKDMPHLKPFVEAIKQSFETAEKWQNKIEQYHVVQYESILDDPSAFANKLSEILNIQFHSSLAKPTVLNGRQQWKGNSAFKDSLKNVEETKSGWQSQLTKFEIKCVNKKLKKYLSNYGYDKINPKNLKNRSAKEHWRNYIKNRLYFHFNI